MKQTNQLGLPDSIVRAVAAQEYDKGSADFSATELLKPPQVRALTVEHYDKLSEDASDSIWRLLGSGVHRVLEDAYKGSEAVLERRLFASMEVGGTEHVISGAMDVFESGQITDYKVTSTYKVIKNSYEDWEAQLNIYDWLCRENGIPVNELRIVSILRDWKKSQRFKKDYPEAPVVVIPIEQWLPHKQEEFIRSRIEDHIDLPPRYCTKEETWNGVRCRDWCPVAEFCPQYSQDT